MTTNDITARDFYENIKLCGKSLYVWIGDINVIESIRLCFCWAACHISFSFVQLNGPFYTDEKDILQHWLFFIYEVGILTILDDDLEMFIFHYLAGRYAHLIGERSYTDRTTQILHRLDTKSQLDFTLEREPEKDLFRFPPA